MWSRVENAPACSTFFAVRAKAEQRYGVPIKAIVIQEAGLDGFSIHRLLLADGIESHVVMRLRLRSTGGIGEPRPMRSTSETLLRTLMAWARGERRVCSMVRGPRPEEEDRRRLTRDAARCLRNAFSTPKCRGLDFDRRARAGAAIAEDGRSRPGGFATAGKLIRVEAGVSRPKRRGFRALTPMALAGPMPRRRRLRFVASPSRRPTGCRFSAPGPIRRRFASLDSSACGAAIFLHFRRLDPIDRSSHLVGP